MSLKIVLFVEMNTHTITAFVLQTVVKSTNQKRKGANHAVSNGGGEVKIFNRVGNALKVAWLIYKNPTLLLANNFKMLADLLGLIMKVAKERSPYMTRMAFIMPDGTEQDIVSIWAGAGAGADPEKRIRELQLEISALKGMLIKEPE